MAAECSPFNLSRSPSNRVHFEHTIENQGNPNRDGLCRMPLSSVPVLQVFSLEPNSANLTINGLS
jgi:hypothetical protein